MRLGKKQVLTVVKKVDFGVYLGNDEERVLLPKKQVPAGIEPGDPVEVFLYKDSDDRLIATTNEPKLELGELPCGKWRFLTDDEVNYLYKSVNMKKGTKGNA